MKVVVSCFLTRLDLGCIEYGNFLKLFDEITALLPEEKLIENFVLKKKNSYQSKKMV